MANMRSSKHPNSFVPVTAALIMIILRLLLYYFGWILPNEVLVLLFLHLLAVMCLVIYGIWPRPRKTDFLTDIKAAMKAAGIYALAIAAFIVFYYSFLEPDFFSRLNEQAIAAQMAESPEVDPVKIRTNVEGFFNLRNFTALIFIGFLFFGGFYSVIFTALKKVVFKNRY